MCNVFTNIRGRTLSICDKGRKSAELMLVEVF
jgi:hypothetical protein